MNRIITFAVEKDTGLVVSRVDSEIAVPVLQYEKMLPENNFTPTYELEKMSVYALQPWQAYKWTRKVPLELKNRHRAFWGFKAVTA